jgi:hypothetical protein
MATTSVTIVASIVPVVGLVTRLWRRWWWLRYTHFDLLTVYLATVHVFDGIVGVLVFLEFYIGKTFVKHGMNGVTWHFDVLNRSVSAKYFLNVIFGHIATQTTHEYAR